jgi:hypothetical protein
LIDPPDEALLVVAVEDLEPLRQPGFAPVQAQQAVGDAVEGADPHAARAGRPSNCSMRWRISAAALFVKVTARMPCGEHADHFGQPRDAVHQHARLAAAGAGQHERNGPGGALTASRCASFSSRPARQV